MRNQLTHLRIDVDQDQWSSSLILYELAQVAAARNGKWWGVCQANSIGRQAIRGINLTKEEWRGMLKNDLFFLSFLEELRMLFQQLLHQMFSNESQLVSLQLSVAHLPLDDHEVLREAPHPSSNTILNHVHAACISLRRLQIHLKYGCLLEDLINHVPNLEQLLVWFENRLERKYEYRPTITSNLPASGLWFEKVRYISCHSLSMYRHREWIVFAHRSPDFNTSRWRVPFVLMNNFSIWNGYWTIFPIFTNFDCNCALRKCTQTIKAFGKVFPMLTSFFIAVYLIWSWHWSISTSVLLWDAHYQRRRLNKSSTPFRFIHYSWNINGPRFDVCRTLNGCVNTLSLLHSIQLHPCTIWSELFFCITDNITRAFPEIVQRYCKAAIKKNSGSIWTHRCTRCWHDATKIIQEFHRLLFVWVNQWSLAAVNLQSSCLIL